MKVQDLDEEDDEIMMEYKVQNREKSTKLITNDCIQWDILRGYNPRRVIYT